MRTDRVVCDPRLATRVRAACAGLSVAVMLGPAGMRAVVAQGLDSTPAGFRVTYGPRTLHFNPSEEHVRYNHLVSLERLDPRWTVWGAARSQIGLALFDNSFGQFSQYVYVGNEWDVARPYGSVVSVGVTAGLLHGYRGPYRDKIPFNRFGTAPAVIPSIGVRYGRLGLSANLLGANGILAAAQWTF